MAPDEMHYALEQAVNRLASHVYDDIQPEERDFYLNLAMDIFVKNRFWNRSDDKQVGFSGSQKRIDDLREITEFDYQDVIASPDLSLNYAFFDLPKDYLFKVNIRFEILTDTCSIATLASPMRDVEGRLVSQEEAYSMLKHAHGKTKWKSPISFITQDQVKAFRDERFILKGLRMDYIRQPERISLSSNRSCELAAHTHQEIVDIAAQRILEVTENPRLQTHSKLTQISN